MTKMNRVGVGIIGSGFVAGRHVEALRHVPNAEVVGCASARAGHARALADAHGIPRVCADYRELLEMEEVSVVTLAVPNFLHAEVCVEAAKAGKHVIVEKPLALTLEEADRMIEACQAGGVKLMYAEQLCFAPKYVRAKQLLEAGALGELYMVRHSEKHSGPHAAWFWDVEKSGGGVVLDMGCHAFQLFRWLKHGVPVARVYASLGTYVHGDKTEAEDNVVVIVTFEDGSIGVCEASWARLGGKDDRVELYGTKGLVYADLLMGSSLLTYSEPGYEHAVEKAPTTKGWTFTMFEEIWNSGFPQEMQHFADCVMYDRPPLLTGEDGRAVLEVVYAAYASAARGAAVELPFRPLVARPVDLWRTSS